MLFGKTKNLVGLDIGSSSVKAVELASSGRPGSETYKLRHLGIEPLPPQTIVERDIIDNLQVSEAIKKLFTEHKIKNRNVCTGIAGNSVIVKKFSLAQMTPEELAESIHWEAEQYIPFPIADVNLDYQAVESSKAAEQGKMEVLLAAAKKDKIGGYTSVITQSGKNTMVVDVDAFAVQNAYEVNYEMPINRVVALLNIGASLMNINILYQGVSIFSRDISIGGNNYTDAIQKGLNLSYEKAEAAKRGESTDGASPQQVSGIMSEVSDDLKNEIQKTFEFFKATSGQEKVDQIMLSGGTAKVVGLADLLADKFNTPVELLNPFRNVGFNPKVFDPDYIADVAPFATVAVGLALRKVGDR
ncbi:MAG: type IV pilus assembly protein PilM [Acidobacteriota bacterium]